MVRISQPRPGRLGNPTKAFLSRSQPKVDNTSTTTISQEDRIKEAKQDRARQAVNRLRDEIAEARARASSAKTERFRQQQLFLADQLTRLIDKAETGDFEPDDLVKFANQKADARTSRSIERRKLRKAPVKTKQVQVTRTGIPALSKFGQQKAIERGEIFDITGTTTSPRGSQVAKSPTGEFITEDSKGVRRIVKPIGRKDNKTVFKEEKAEIKFLEATTLKAVPAVDFGPQTDVRVTPSKVSTLLTKIDIFSTPDRRNRATKGVQGFFNPREKERTRVEDQLLRGRENEITTLNRDIESFNKRVGGKQLTGKQFLEARIDEKVLQSRVKESEKNALTIEKVLQDFNNERKISKNPPEALPKLVSAVALTPVTLVDFGAKFVKNPDKTAKDTAVGTLVSFRDEPLNLVAEVGGTSVGSGVLGAPLKGRTARVKAQIRNQRAQVKELNKIVNADTSGFLGNAKTTKLVPLSNLKTLETSLKGIEKSRLDFSKQQLVKSEILKDFRTDVRLAKKNAFDFNIKELEGKNFVNLQGKGRLTKGQLDILDTGLSKRIKNLEKGLRNDKVLSARKFEGKFKRKKRSDGLLDSLPDTDLNLPELTRLGKRLEPVLTPNFLRKSPLARFNLKTSSELLRGFELRSSAVRKGKKTKKKTRDPLFNLNKLEEDLRIKTSKPLKGKDLGLRAQLLSKKKVDFKTKGELKQQRLFPKAFDKLNTPKFDLTKNPSPLLRERRTSSKQALKDLKFNINNKGKGRSRIDSSRLLEEKPLTGVTRGDLFKDFLRRKIKERPLAVEILGSKPRSKPQSTGLKLPKLDVSFKQLSVEFKGIKSTKPFTPSSTKSTGRSLLLVKQKPIVKELSLTSSKTSSRSRSSSTQRLSFLSPTKNRPRSKNSFDLRKSELAGFGFGTRSKTGSDSANRLLGGSLRSPSFRTGNLLGSSSTTRPRGFSLSETSLLKSRTVRRSRNDRRRKPTTKKKRRSGDDLAFVEGFTARALKLKPIKISVGSGRGLRSGLGIRRRPVLTRRKRKKR